MICEWPDCTTELEESSGKYQRKYCDEHVNAARRRGAFKAGPQYDSDRRLDRSTGYVMIFKDGGWWREHRVVMEDILGRKLRSGESVVHRNGDHSDNSPENLLLKTVVDPFVLRDTEDLST